MPVQGFLASGLSLVLGAGGSLFQGSGVQGTSLGCWP